MEKYIKFMESTQASLHYKCVYLKFIIQKCFETMQKLLFIAASSLELYPDEN